MEGPSRSPTPPATDSPLCPIRRPRPSLTHPAPAGSVGSSRGVAAAGCARCRGWLGRGRLAGGAAGRAASSGVAARGWWMGGATAVAGGRAQVGLARSSRGVHCVGSGAPWRPGLLGAHPGCWFASCRRAVDREPLAGDPLAVHRGTWNACNDTRCTHPGTLMRATWSGREGWRSPMPATAVAGGRARGWGCPILAERPLRGGVRPRCVGGPPPSRGPCRRGAWRGCARGIGVDSRGTGVRG